MESQQCIRVVSYSTQNCQIGNREGNCHLCLGIYDTAGLSYSTFKQRAFNIDAQTNKEKSHHSLDLKNQEEDTHSKANGVLSRTPTQQTVHRVIGFLVNKEPLSTMALTQALRHLLLKV